MDLKNSEDINPMLNSFYNKDSDVKIFEENEK